jgi:uncharacterized protein YkwD
MSIRVAYPILIGVALAFGPAAAQESGEATGPGAFLSPSASAPPVKPAAPSPAGAPANPKPKPAAAQPRPEPEAVVPRHRQAQHPAPRQRRETRHTAPRPRAEPVSSDSLAAAQVVSAFRAANGLAAVAADPALTRAAKAQADAMAKANTMSHEIGGTFPSRLQAAGIGASAAAENIAVGQADIAEAMKAWETSSGHRKNMLMSNATRVGLARAYGGGRPYWALILAAPELPRREAAAEAGPQNGYFGSAPPLFGGSGFSIGPFSFGK